jgi:phosphatidylglycerophosphate synthase
LARIESWIILVIAVVTGLSDFLDGMVARVRGQISELGAFLDPLGDKLFALALGLMVWRRGWVEPELLIILLLLETHALVLPLMSMARRRLRKLPMWPPPKVRPNWWGKWKTALLGGSLGLVILGEVCGWSPVAWFGHMVLWLSAGVGLVAYLLYCRDWARGAYV